MNEAVQVKKRSQSGRRADEGAAMQRKSSER